MPVVQPDIRLTWAAAMQREPARFQVLEHWMVITDSYVGIYFRLRDSNTTAVANCHVSLLHLTGKAKQAAPTAKTCGKFCEIVKHGLATWSKQSPAYPEPVFALVDAIRIEKVIGIVHRTILTVHVGSWFHEVFMKARQVAAVCTGIVELRRDNFHISVDRVFVGEEHVEALALLL